MKKRILIIGISMFCAGTEKAFLSMADAINYEQYDVDLLLAKKEGPLLGFVPKQINVIEIDGYNDMFLLSSENAVNTIWNCFIRKNPLTAFDVFPYFLKMILSPKTRPSEATKMWCALMKKYAKPFDNGEYDAAIAYWGDRTMFYMADKVIHAKKKLAWLHFDYGNPPRDDGVYLKYFNKCDTVVTVSDAVDRALKDKLPQIAGKCVAMENIINPKLIRRLALEGETFPDKHFKGTRILSVCRLSEQKGVDFIVPVLAKLRGEGYDLRWYIIGWGTESERAQLVKSALEAGVADILILLGTKLNPYAFMRDCDIFVLPSRYEGKPITVEEAKILFKPIVVSDYLSAREQLWDGELGIITKIGSDGLYDGLKQMLDSERLRDSFTVKLSKCDFGNSGEINKLYEMIDAAPRT